MYRPAPPRPKKTSIVRTRTGCKGCRKRRTKCDENKPSCGTCTRLGKPCEQFSPKLRFRNLTCPSSRTQRSPQRANNSSNPGGLSSIILSYDSPLPQDLPCESSSDNITQQANQSVVAPMKSWAEEFILPAVDGLPVSTWNTPFAFSEGIPVEHSGWSTQQHGLSELLWHYSDGSSTFEVDQIFNTWDISELPFTYLERAIYSPDLDNRNGEARACMPPTLPPHRDTCQLTLFYMDVWKKKCLPALHLAFHKLDASNGPKTLVTDTIVALSACRLSRVSPQRKPFTVSRKPWICLRPDSGHESLGHEHYGSVMRRMARWSNQDFDTSPTLSLAVLVLFCYLESSMGNFKEFRLHSEGTKSLIQSYPDDVASSGAELVAAWVEVEMQNWWRRVYFGTPEFHRSHSNLSLSPWVEAILNTTDQKRATVLLILSESHRLNSTAIVSCWDGHEDLCHDPSPHATARTGGAGKRDSLIGFKGSLKAQSARLDDWFARLSVLDLPEYDDGKGKHLAPGRKELGIQPLRFSSHISAMNFAYYITARVLQSTGPLESLEQAFQVDVDQTYEEVESWVSILIRIAAGIDWERCVQLNCYTVGFASLLLACALRSRNLATGVWMQDWLEERLKGDNFEEGNFPVFQILEALRLVNSERRNGRDVFALFQTVDDRGGSGKLGSYHSQVLSSLQVYGRCRTTGKMYSYCKNV